MRSRDSKNAMHKPGTEFLGMIGRTADQLSPA